MEFNNRYIYHVDMLRGIAAFLMVLFHMKPFIEYNLPGKADYFDGSSYLGVAVFFILSGFVIGMSTTNSTSVFSWL